ncbi:hypothetical protein POV96_21965 [Klebsiella pneumoniae]|uniref:hypothetical protein n=1 Tax=Klebsiella pneumoniae complex TaxID=3390273 RepID=UPI0003BE8E4F|nr:hypothetical protein [Klebsiella pneumoniae]ESL29942.1 hypothetical protein L477_00260 [Klebsiella pneumoniae BIDMC 40]MCD9664322.1 hypothetical protein [Klebsiella pneumoniae]MCE0061806.1 hypothetical protein [Klebsiella pneumoniae]SLV42177.1 Uncharacterised protein [Klebsiella pneumoniae]SLV76890.1 Uncharacterised protein [Klebsiella pneumoniae]
MNIETVNELIASLESAGELSIREQKYLALAKAFKQVTAERDAALNAECVWEKTMMEVCGEDGPASVAAEIRNLRALRDTALQALKSQVEQLAAENVGLKAAFNKPDAWLSCHSIPPTYQEPDRGGEYLAVHEHPGEKNDDGSDSWPVYAKPEIETPATDRIVAGIKADGVEEFIGLLQQHVDEGDFVGDEVAVIVGAIDCGKEFFEQLREGADK